MRPSIDKILFAATKADHITPSQYNNLRALLEAMAMREGRFPGLGEGAGTGAAYRPPVTSRQGMIRLASILIKFLKVASRSTFAREALR